VIWKKINDSGKTYDRLIYLPRGGLAFARQILDCTGILKFSDTTINSYSGIGERGKVRIISPLTDSVDGESVLVLDDIADSGNTLIKSKEYLLTLGARDVGIATIYTKPRSNIKPDYFAQEVKNDVWIVFPGERAEFIKDAVGEWGKNNIPYTEYRGRLLDIGLPIRYVDYFLPRVLPESQQTTMRLP
jgi:hypoxanthine phosphoribosyltransferase